MGTEFYLGLGFGAILGAFVTATVWYTEVMLGKSLAARRARDAFHFPDGVRS